MKKIRLNLDHLEVESFLTTSVPEERGTVEANFSSRPGDTYCGGCTVYICPTDPNLC